MENRKRRFFFFWLVVGVVLGTAIPLLIFDGTRINLNNTTTTVTTVTTIIPTTTVVPTTTAVPTPNSNGCIIQPPPSIPPVCDPLYNLPYQESPNLSYDGIPLRFFYDTNFRRPIYIYQPLNDIEIIVVTPTWNYTINVGYNPTTSHLLVDCSGNIYVFYSSFTVLNATIVKINPFGLLQWTNSIPSGGYMWEPSIYLNNIYFLDFKLTTLNSSLVKIDIENGTASFLPNVVCSGTLTCRLNVFADKIYNLEPSTTQGGPIVMYDLNGTFINQTTRLFNPYGGYVSPDGFLYYLGYESPFSTNGNIFKIDRNLTLIWNITLTGSAANFIPWTMDWMATKLFVYQDILYYIASTSYTNGITYLSSYSDIDGSFISTTNHAFSNNLGDVTMNFDPLSKSAYFLGLQQPNGLNPIGAAINTFCIP